MQIIYISGIDGCGKTTQAKLLVKRLKKIGIDAEYMWFRWEPTLEKVINIFKYKKEKTKSSPPREELEDNAQDAWLATKHRLLSNRFFRTMWMLYATGDYYLTYKKKIKEVNSNIIVIDRYVSDFIIDQAVNLKLNPKESSSIKKNFFLKQFCHPNLNIIIDLPAKEGYSRKKDGTSFSYLKIREPYYKEIKGPDTLHIDGLKSVENLAESISNWVANNLQEIQK